LNAAARLVFSARRSDQATSRRYSANGIGLEIPERIQFQLGVLCLHNTAPAYVRHTLPSRYNWSVMWMLEDIFAPPIPRRWLYLRGVVERWVTVIEDLQRR